MVILASRFIKAIIVGGFTKVLPAVVRAAKSSEERGFRHFVRSRVKALNTTDLASFNRSDQDLVDHTPDGPRFRVNSIISLEFYNLMTTT